MKTFLKISLIFLINVNLFGSLPYFVSNFNCDCIPDPDYTDKEYNFEVSVSEYTKYYFSLTPISLLTASKGSYFIKDGVVYFQISPFELSNPSIKYISVYKNIYRIKEIQNFSHLANKYLASCSNGSCEVTHFGSFVGKKLDYEYRGGYCQFGLYGIHQFFNNNGSAKFSACSFSFDPEKFACVNSCPEGAEKDEKTGLCKKKEPPKNRPNWCPEPMNYNKKDVEYGFFGRKTIEECLPIDLSPDECENKGMVYHSCYDIFDDNQLKQCMQYPQGCYAKQTSQHFLSESQLDNDLFVFSGILGSLPIKSMKNGLPSLFDFFKNLFNKNPTNKPSLLNFRPEIVDIKATKEGPSFMFDLKKIDDGDILSNYFFKKTGKFNEIPPNSTTAKKLPQILANISPKFKDFDFPNDISASKIQNNSLITAKLKNIKAPMPTKDIGEIKDLKVGYDFESLFGNKTTSNLPMTLKRVSKKR